MKKLFIFVFYIFAALGCGDTFDRQNSLQPMYEQQEFDEQDQIINLVIESEIEPVKIEPSLIRKIVKVTFGWVPLLGDLIELPLDLGSALLPNLPALEIGNIPDEAAINDPDVQDIVKSVQVNHVYLMLTPDDQLPEDIVKKKCFLIFDCRVKNLDFISEIGVYIALKGDEDKGILIAKTTEQTIALSEKTSILLDTTEDINLKQILLDIEKYEIRTLVRGKPPKRNIYIQGGVSLAVKLKLDLN